jgi:toxin ParE1/3/4
MKVVWTEYALHTLEQVHGYIARENPKAASRVIAKLKRATRKLSQFPSFGRVGVREGTRELVIGNLPYIVVYRVRAPEVQIVRVFHDKQLREQSLRQAQEYFQSLVEPGVSMVDELLRERREEAARDLRESSIDPD